MREKIICAIPFVLLLLAVGFIGGAESAERITVPCICALMCVVAGLFIATEVELKDEYDYCGDEDGEEE